MFDTVNDPKSTFAGLTVEAIAAYGNGKFANFAAAKREFPQVPVLQVDVSGQGIGDTGDFEPGDMSYSRAGSWAKERINAGVTRPVIYFSASHWGEIMASLAGAGLKRRDVRIWTAHYTGHAHLCSSACGFGIKGAADATQWGSQQEPGSLRPPYKDRVIDVSLTTPDFFGDDAASMSGLGAAPVHVPPFPGRELTQPPAMSGDDVHRWQVRMAHRGWKIPVSGTYDAASEKVCRKFQAEKGLHVDGVVGPETWRLAFQAPIT